LKEFDAIIIGGGPAGAATTLALTQRGFSATVIERSDYSEPRIGENFPPAIKNPLTALGVWERFLAANHSPSFGIRSVWGSHEPHDNDSILNPYGAGWHVDRARFDAMLAQAAEDAGASVIRGGQLLSCVADSSGWGCEISCRGHRQKLHAKLVVDATGRSSTFACRHGAHRMVCDHLIGVIGFLRDPSSRPTIDNFTLVEAVEGGWWYSAPLPGSQIVAAYMTDADLYARSRKTSADVWQQQLRKAPLTRLRLPSAPASRSFIVAAHSSRLDSTVGSDWLAVGDAAAAFDPLSSQGVYRALSSGLRGAETIEAHLAGDSGALADYASEVRASFDTFLRLRALYYGRERRWPNSVFWQRRAHAVTMMQ
jgi:flavin-dependent dehydrogenase